MKEELEKLRALPFRTKFVLGILATIVGLVFGAFAFFQIFFLSKVIPHGGLW